MAYFFIQSSILDFIESKIVSNLNQSRASFGKKNLCARVYEFYIQNLNGMQVQHERITYSIDIVN